MASSFFALTVSGHRSIVWLQSEHTRQWHDLSFVGKEPLRVVPPYLSVRLFCYLLDFVFTEATAE